MKPLVIALAVAALAAAAGVHAAETNVAGLHWGDLRSLGAGKARAWVAVDGNGNATSMGVSIDEAAMKVKRDKPSIEAVLPLPGDVKLAGTASGVQPTFRVRYDREHAAYIVILEGVSPALASPSAVSARAEAR